MTLSHCYDLITPLSRLCYAAVMTLSHHCYDFVTVMTSSHTGDRDTHITRRRQRHTHHTQETQTHTSHAGDTDTHITRRRQRHTHHTQETETHTSHAGDRDTHITRRRQRPTHHTQETETSTAMYSLSTGSATHGPRSSAPASLFGVRLTSLKKNPYPLLFVKTKREHTMWQEESSAYTDRSNNEYIDQMCVVYNCTSHTSPPCCSLPYHFIE